MSTSEISEMKSPYQQIFKFKGQHWTLMEIFVFRGQSQVLEKIGQIPKQGPQGQLFRKYFDAPKPMSQNCSCKLFHLPKRSKVYRKKLGYKKFYPQGPRVLGSFEGCNPNLSQFPLFLGKIISSKLNQTVTFWCRDLQRVSKNRCGNILQGKFIKRSTVTDSKVISTLVRKNSCELTWLQENVR